MQIHGSNICSISIRDVLLIISGRSSQEKRINSGEVTFVISEMKKKKYKESMLHKSYSYLFCREGVFSTLVVEMVSWVYPYIQTHPLSVCNILCVNLPE